MKYRTHERLRYQSILAFRQNRKQKIRKTS